MRVSIKLPDKQDIVTSSSYLTLEIYLNKMAKTQTLSRFNSNQSKGKLAFVF